MPLAHRDIGGPHRLRVRRQGSGGRQQSGEEARCHPSSATAAACHVPAKHLHAAGIVPSWKLLGQGA